MKIKLLFLIPVYIITLLIPTLATAAIFSINGYESELYATEPTMLRVLVNTEGETLNAFSGTLLFNPQEIRIQEIREGDSLINFWIEKPTLSGGSISFSGIITGGLVSPEAQLFSIIAVPQKEGDIKFTWKDAESYLNDGQGTLTVTRSGPTTLMFGPQSGAVQRTFEDTTSPEDFSPLVSRDKELFDNQLFIVFETKDKASGISYYEVGESSQKTLDTVVWQKTTSPYVLKDQTRNSYVFVKAVDKQGNERIATVFPDKKSLQPSTFIVLFAILVAVLSTLWYFVSRRKKLQRPL